MRTLKTKKVDLATEGLTVNRRQMFDIILLAESGPRTSALDQEET